MGYPNSIVFTLTYILTDWGQGTSRGYLLLQSLIKLWHIFIFKN
jgi:hypothetical protein